MSIPVQPGETSETAALRVLASRFGWNIGYTTNGGHAPGSLHYVGRAIDIDAAYTKLLAINKQILEVIPLQFISEMILFGGICVKNGKVVNGNAVYGSTVMNNHKTHIHLAVVKGFSYQGGSMPDDPNLPNITGPVSLHVLQDSAGNCTGYYIFSEKTGELHSFGPGTKYFGRSEVIQ